MPVQRPAMTYYNHPRRLPKNCPGPFYTLGHIEQCGNWCGACLACEAPEMEAPELLAPLNQTNIDTYFVRQPVTPEEVEHACRAAEVCCVAALRYGGTDPEIIRRLGNTDGYSDYIVVCGKLLLVGGPHRPRWWRSAWRWLRSWFSGAPS